VSRSELRGDDASANEQAAAFPREAHARFRARGGCPPHRAERGAYTYAASSAIGHLCARGEIGIRCRSTPSANGLPRRRSCVRRSRATETDAGAVGRSSGRDSHGSPTYLCKSPTRSSRRSFRAPACSACGAPRRCANHVRRRGEDSWVVLIEARRYRRLLVSYLRNGGNLVEIRQATECSHEEIRRLLRGQLVFVTEGRARRIETLLSAKGREWRAGRDATTSAWGWCRPAWSPRAQGGVRATRPASDRARARGGRATPHAGARARALAGWQLPEQASTAGSPGARGRRANEAAPCAANCTATDPKSQLSHAPT
jgi:hypothetical protein